MASLHYHLQDFFYFIIHLKPKCPILSLSFSLPHHSRPSFRPFSGKFPTWKHTQLNSPKKKTHHPSFNVSKLHMESRKPEIPSGFSDPSKPFSGSNGTIPPEKNRFPATKTQYKECLKNHAATIGGHALDGCGEFMPESGDVFKCAACGCHRNFHRRESDPAEHSGGCECFLRPPHLKRGSPSSPYNSAPQMLLALSAGLGEAEEGTLVHQGSKPGARKRFRTKFTQEQKEKMQSFSERVGWKMAKQDDSLIQQFCNEIGVGRTVLKVWMHNNKHAFGRKDSNTTC